jgi:hypothetical protein
MDKHLPTVVLVVATLTLVWFGVLVVERNRPVAVSLDDFGGFYTEMRR